MFALRNKKVFKTKKEATNKYNQTKPRPITYDEFFLIWGNSDIRIKSGTNELFSSYGTANASYEEVGNEEPVIDDLFQIPDRETPLADYELFAIEFDKWNRQQWSYQPLEHLIEIRLNLLLNQVTINKI